MWDFLMLLCLSQLDEYLCGPTALLRLVDIHVYSVAVLEVLITSHSQAARSPMELSLSYFG